MVGFAERFALGVGPFFGALTPPGFDFDKPGFEELLALTAAGALICLRRNWHGRLEGKTRWEVITCTRGLYVLISANWPGSDHQVVQSHIRFCAVRTELEDLRLGIGPPC